jgi:hypothetical protein
MKRDKGSFVKWLFGERNVSPDFERRPQGFAVSTTYTEGSK